MKCIRGVPEPVYSAVHSWLKRTFGKADHCENTGCAGRSKHFDWSLIKDEKQYTYEFKRENFWQLCKSCHVKYDMTEETIIKMKRTKSNEARQNMSRAQLDLWASIPIADRKSGFEGGHHSEEFKGKISRVHKGNKYNVGRKASEATKIKMSLSQMGHHVSEETRRKISLILKGKPKSEAHRKIMSLQRKGKPVSEEAKRNISIKLKGVNTWSKGCVVSEETRKKISEANKGKVVSKETMEKISKAQKGVPCPKRSKPCSEETRRKIGLANKKAWAETMSFKANKQNNQT